jgi:F-box and WD-40 domain protein CDC4
MGDSVVTSLVVNDEYIVIGMANKKIHVFDATTGHYRLSLLGHELGVWALVLVGKTKSSSRNYDQPQAKRWEDNPSSSRRASFSASQAGNTTPTFRSNSAADNQPSRSARSNKRMRSSDVCGSAEGWGLKRTLVVSGGCDREVRVWDIVTGECVHALRGHSSTIRCLKVLDGRPIAVSGSRDFTLRVWDIDRGRMLRVLEGHDQSVRCIEVAGNQVVSGSYDYTCRVST